jgi:putative transcriptional regulator
MSVNRLVQLLPLLVALLLPASLLGATLPNSDVNQGQPSLAGQLLIAAPDMPDARYRRTVVVVVQHGPEGGFGIVINRSTGEQPMEDLFTVIGEKNETATGSVPLFSGGPVQPENFYVLHSTEYHRAETAEFAGDVAMTASPKIFHDIAAKVGPKKFLIAFGYVGWAPGQLEAQMAIKAWLTAPLDPTLVFDADRDKLWQLAIEGRMPGLRDR